MFLKKDLFKDYLESVGMIPDDVLGGSKRQELTEDEYKKRNMVFRDKCQNTEIKVTKRTVVLMCFLFLMCFLSIYLLFHMSSQVNNPNLGNAYKYIASIATGVIIPICLMLMKLHRESTVFQITMLILESPYPEEAARTVSELYLKIFYKKELSKTRPNKKEVNI
ncbi:MAG: hypothetical protein HQL05_13915 [Nitrospirae bacterium]|nr:hypothetical protein [Nitrospirota bacterium]